MLLRARRFVLQGPPTSFHPDQLSATLWSWRPRPGALSPLAVELLLAAQRVPLWSRNRESTLKENAFEISFGDDLAGSFGFESPRTTKVSLVRHFFYPDCAGNSFLFG